MYNFDSKVRKGVDIIKYQCSHRQPPYELPADSFIEDGVREILQLTENKNPEVFIKDLTLNDLIELVKVWYPFKEGLDFEGAVLQYTVYIPEWYEDAQEKVQFTFKAITMGNRVDKIELLIVPTLDYVFRWFTPDGIDSLAHFNQFAFNEKLRDLGLAPVNFQFDKYGNKVYDTI